MLKKLARKTVDKNQSTFSFKEGFHELPYLANSPEAIVRSIDQMPFVTHDLKGQCISPKTKYMKGMMHYQKIEDGFWMIHGDLDYKANILYRSVDDKTLASDYYFLSFKLFAQHQKKKLGLINGSAYTNRSWLLFKPKANAADCHFAGSKELTFSMFFNKKWLKENLSRKNYFRQSSLAEFFKSDSRYIIWPDLDETNDDLCIQICQVFQKKGRKGVSDPARLKELALTLLKSFIIKYNTDAIGDNFYDIPDQDRLKIHLAEKMLTKNLFTKFPGIELLASTAGMSGTKLKNTFKQVYGESPLKYFQGKQMRAARQLLMEAKSSISEVANQFQYENTGKFSSAFRKQLGILPSQVSRTR